MKVTQHKPDRGFTMVELIIVTAFLGIFFSPLLPSLGTMRARAERVVCLSNLRSLHASLASYLTDHRQWPQVPEELPINLVPKFWVDSLKEYGTTQKVWICPTLQREHRENPSRFDLYPEIHYMPAEFDEKAATPHKWPAMPWAIEIGNMHGEGNFVIRADGGIKGMDELIREANGAAVHKLE